MSFDRDVVELLNEINRKIGEFDGKMDRALCELQKINSRVRKHEERLDEHDRQISKLNTYYRMISGVMGAVGAIIGAALASLISLFRS